LTRVGPSSSLAPWRNACLPDVVVVFAPVGYVSIPYVVCDQGVWLYAFREGAVPFWFVYARWIYGAFKRFRELKSG
jgi:hypothetical protein